ncbi:PPK2 family polyphosphate:nucleotide phosphotransferase [Agromyces hippuratus]|uniref:PPK2 family polyphosphate:nucleotide phosphotransferase n=1 Tax=Agromyces hippuratus TaxID=286438 RepID=A0A852WUX1_9MICO|nr:PPK2 family polyphosphate kinase [Agromyces hippuratus]NYG22122.1 PPK2 family polyphosphate:nucleotide phosphotransferase [Agromyces hippuratus]
MSRETYWTADPADLLRVGEGFELSKTGTRANPGFDGDKAAGQEALAEGAEILADLQEQLFAMSRMGGDERRILLVLQAMDTAGKGGIVKHVMGAVDPQGVQLSAFKKPTDEELEHDFLWRIHKRAPGAGMIGVFDRSHYEDVLIGRVRSLASPEEIERRYEAINEFEAELAATGTTIIKVMLHISRDEQKARLTERLARADKHWKFNPGDVDERLRWDDYAAAYQLVFERTATTDAPWFVVPADRKWYARLAVQHLLIDALEAMQLEWPKADYDVAEQQARLAAS